MSQNKKLSIAAILVWLIYLISLVPLWILGFFNYPSADDINMGIPAHEAFAATGNIFAALGKGLYMAWYDYMNWMGYFTSTALMSVPPSVFGIQFYPAGVFILSISLTAATAFFMYTVLMRLAGMERPAASVICALTLLFTLQSLPAGMPRVETLYWYCSGANYILTWCLGLCYLALLIRIGLSEKRKIPVIVLTCILGFLTGGGNYMTALSCTIAVVLALIWILLPISGQKRDTALRLILPTVFLLAGFAVSCLAPGNSVRSASAESFGAVKSIVISLYYTVSYCLNNWTRFEHLLLMLFLAPVFWRQAPNLKLSFRFPAVIAVLAYGLTSANVTPPLYALSNIEAGRLQALFYIQYMLLLVLTEGYIIGWLRKRVFTSLSSYTTESATKSVVLFQLTTAAAFIFFSALTVGVSSDYYMSTEAVRELADGSAAGYRAENEERFAILMDENVTDAVLKPYENRPALLLYSDIDSDPGNWLNDGLARYFHKNSVRRADQTAGSGG